MRQKEQRAMEGIWRREVSLAQLNRLTAGNLVGHLGIVFTEIGPDFLTAVMPVDARTIQPAGLLHGGASAALAETLGSFAGHLTIDSGLYACVGQELNASHLRPVSSGTVTATARPLRLGRRSQVWSIVIVDDRKRQVCAARLTLAVVGREREAGGEGEETQAE